MCHAVTGTDATARTGPDLTHLRSRLTLAAATTADTTGLLESWILDPQHLKPGARMPSFALPREQLADLIAYLETLR